MAAWASEKLAPLGLRVHRRNHVIAAHWEPAVSTYAIAKAVGCDFKSRGKVQGGGALVLSRVRQFQPVQCLSVGLIIVRE